MSFSWQTRSMSSAAAAAPAAPAAPGRGRVRERAALLRAPRPELALLIAIAALLDLWALSRNAWANDYYSAAVRSMSSSWRDFLYASLDPSGVMTTDKPPLSLWVQALSVRAFGYHPLSMLVPQALMGIASVVLTYDLVRRVFGRAGGFVAGLALALTPIMVAVSRHNNPDALLVLCSVAALWFAVRALEDGRARWLALAGVCVGLGFETKMGVALTVVPGIAAAWLWCAPAGRGRLHALRQLLGAGGAMVAVAGAWPALVELTPAADRPWVSGTSDNSVLSLIFGYNGLGRVDGQSGGPGGAGPNMFGGTPGPLRLLNQALGGQAGWLLGFAIASGVAILLSSRLRRADRRSGWLIAVGGAFAVTAALFSAASGIFHPYYVSLLAPFAAALVGAGAAQLIDGRLRAKVVGPLAIVAGAAIELFVLGRYPATLAWLPPLLVAGCALSALALAVLAGRRARAAAVSVALATLLLAPAVWAVDTLGHRASGTFPAGGPASVDALGSGPLGGRTGGPRPPGPATGSAARRALGEGPGGAGIAPPGGRALPGAPGAGAPSGGGFAGGGGFPGAPGGGLPGGGFGGGASLRTVLAYVDAHGGGTLALSSQSSAAAAIVSSGADVAGIGGFSGRESDVSVSWLAAEVASGRIRWVLADGQGAGGFGGGLPADTRAGSRTALSAVAGACRAVTLSSSSTGAGTASRGAGGGTLYDCRGRAAALAAAADRLPGTSS